MVSCHTADSKPVKQEVNGTVILSPVVFPGLTFFVIFRPVQAVAGFKPLNFVDCSTLQLMFGRYDSQYNDTKHNDTQHNDQ